MNVSSSVFLIVAAAPLVSVSANAQDGGEASEAQTKMLEGLRAYDEGNYARAARLLREDLKENPWPTSAYYAGQSLEKLGKLVEAAALYQRALDLPPPAGSTEHEQIQQRAQQDAKQSLAAVERRIPRLTLKIQGARQKRVEITLDDVSLSSESLGEPLRVNPGTHQVVGQCGDERVEPPPVTLSASDQRELSLRFTCGKPPPSRPLPKPAADEPPARSTGTGSTARTLGWVGVGVGGAGLALWGVTGTMAFLKLGNLRDDGCDDQNHCYPSQSDDVSRYNKLRPWSAAGFYVGMPLFAAGVATLLLAPSGTEEGAEGTHVSAWLGLGSAGIRGRFQ